jgi:hypothetical protein
MEQLIAAVLARNSVELRALYSAIGAELKKRKAAGVPAKVAGTSVPATPKAATPKAAPTPKAPATPGPSVVRAFGVRCVSTGKTLKRSYATQAEADAAAADLSVQMKREYQTVAA